MQVSALSRSDKLTSAAYSYSCSTAMNGCFAEPLMSAQTENGDFMGDVLRSACKDESDVSVPLGRGLYGQLLATDCSLLTVMHSGAFRL